MYPIDNESKRQTIFKQYAATIGKGMVNINIQKDDDDADDEVVYVCKEGEYYDVEDVPVTYDDISDTYCRIAYTEPPNVESVWYRDIENGNTYNNRIKTSK
eukprot:10657497-Heterocapsa_arctica.AAC.1